MAYVNFPTHRTVSERPWDVAPIFSKNKGKVHTPDTEWARGKLVGDEFREVLKRVHMGFMGFKNWRFAFWVRQNRKNSIKLKRSTLLWLLILCVNITEPQGAQIYG